MNTTPCARLTLAPACLLTLGLALAATAAGPVRAATPAARAASAALPSVNLLVQLRLVDAATADADDDSAAENLRRRRQGYTVGTQPSGLNAPWLQQAQVLNGQSASLQLTQSQPFQWVRAAGRPAGSGAGSGSGGSNNGGNSGGSNASNSAGNSGGGAVVNEVAWLPSGTAWSVRPEWPGGTAPARVEVDVRAAALQPGPGAAPMPGVATRQTRSTVLAPLDAWVTVARLGGAPAAASGQTWSTEPAGGNAARVLQLRVSQP